MLDRDPLPGNGAVNGLRRIVASRALRHTFTRFLVGGASTTIVSYVIYLLALSILPYLAAYTLAYAAGIVWSYFANTLFVFRQRPALARALAFPIVYIAQYLVGSVLLVALIDRLRMPAAFAPLAVVVLTLPLTYALSRWILVANPAPSPATSGPTMSIRTNARTTRFLSPSHIPCWLDGFVAAGIVLAIALCAYTTWPIDLHVPFLMGGDATSAQYIFKSILEHGSYVLNPDVGAPFGATMYDYPIPEPTHFALIRIIGWFTLDPFAAFNLFYLISFATSALAACWALKRDGVERLPAIAGAIAFAILPYHFMRLAHVFLASYFAVPIFCHYALQLATYRAPHLVDAPRLRWTGALLLAIAAGSGVYYAFFGCLLIAVGALVGAAQSRHVRVLGIGAIHAAVIASVVALSLVPNAIYHLAEGANTMVAQRSQAEAEILGLRITQLLFPTPGHRIAALDAFMAAYRASTPMINENMTAALGVLGSIGLLLAMVVFFSGNFVRQKALWAIGALCTAAILYATVGGFGAIAARLAIPEIRGLNRISVFIAFLSLLALLLGARRLTTGRRYASAALAVLVVAIAWLDQIPVHAIAKAPAAAFATSKSLYAQIQTALPQGTAVFELPYDYFPESPLPPESYYLLEPYLYTQGLRWSFGDMHGRPADLWNARVALLTGKDLARALAQAGFGAIYVDRRGYADHGATTEAMLRSEFGAPILDDAAMARALYRVPAPSPGDSPFVIADLGRNWFPWEPAADHAEEAAWSKGSADLIIANPGPPTAVIVNFKLSTLIARTVTLIYNGEVQAQPYLQPGIASDVRLNFIAKAGVSRLSLQTDTAAQAPGNGDPRRLAFRLQDLEFGVESTRAH